MLLRRLALFLSAACLYGRSAVDPPVTNTFTQATGGMSVVNSYTFGTDAGHTITNLQQLSSRFDPYGIAGHTVINNEWERYQPFNPTNFVFTPNSLNLTATLAPKGGLVSGGINSAQIWTKATYQPGASGKNVYAVSVRLKFPGGAGMWPAIWLFSPSAGDGSEIDILEFFVMQTQNQFDWTGNNHGPGAGSTFYSVLTNPWVWHPGYDFSLEFHDYQLVWTPDATYKYVDDKLIRAESFKWTSSQQAQLGVNLAVGSDEPGLTGLIPTSHSEFPATLQLQSITILAK
jgi:beta-glucanase (GH16 family)